MEATDTSLDGGGGVGDGQVVVVVRMKVEVQSGEGGYDFCAEVIGVPRVEYAEGIRQHETADGAVLQGFQHAVDVSG